MLLNVEINELPVREGLFRIHLDNLLEAGHRAVRFSRSAGRHPRVKPHGGVEDDVPLGQVERMPIHVQLPRDLARQGGLVVGGSGGRRIAHKQAATASRTRLTSMRIRPRLHRRLPMTTSTASPATGETEIGPDSNSTSSIWGPPADMSAPMDSHPI